MSSGIRLISNKVLVFCFWACLCAGGVLPTYRVSAVGSKATAAAAASGGTQMKYAGGPSHILVASLVSKIATNNSTKLETYSVSATLSLPAITYLTSTPSTNLPISIIQETQASGNQLILNNTGTDLPQGSSLSWKNIGVISGIVFSIGMAILCAVGMFFSFSDSRRDKLGNKLTRRSKKRLEDAAVRTRSTMTHPPPCENQQKRLQGRLRRGEDAIHGDTMTSNSSSSTIATKNSLSAALAASEINGGVRYADSSVPSRQHRSEETSRRAVADELHISFENDVADLSNSVELEEATAVRYLHSHASLGQIVQLPKRE